MGDSPTEKKTPKCPHCPHRLSDPTFRFHMEMLEARSKLASKSSQITPPSSAESSNTIRSPEKEKGKEPTIEHGDIDTQTPKPNLDKTISSIKQDTKTPPLEYIHPDKEGISHPLYPDLETLLFGKETEIIDPTSSSPSHQGPDSET
jgi:hypothetical protein